MNGARPWHALSVAALLGAVVLAGCAASDTTDVEIAHVHGTAIDPATGDVYIATHGGLVKGTRDGDHFAWRYVGEQRYDLMGFTQDGVDPQTFYAGGHPGLLGLASSTDGGETWTSHSYFGQADIHALSGVPGVPGAMYAWFREPLMRSTDGGRTWENLTEFPQGVYSVAAANMDRVYLATRTGLVVTDDGGRSTTPLAGGTFLKVATNADESVLLAARPGQGERIVKAVRSTDQGRTWMDVADPELAAAQHEISLAANPDDAQHWVAVTSMGLAKESRDGGMTWTTIRPA
jgi:hypothetical protein